MVFLNKKILLIIALLLSVKLNAEVVKYFFAEIQSESSIYKYSSRISCLFELDENTLKFRNNPKIDLGYLKIGDMNTSSYCKQFYRNNKLKKLEIYQTTPYLPINKASRKLNNFKEIKLLKRYIFNKDEQVFF